MGWVIQRPEQLDIRSCGDNIPKPPADSPLGPSIPAGTKIKALPDGDRLIGSEGERCDPFYEAAALVAKFGRAITVHREACRLRQRPVRLTVIVA